MSVAGKSVGDNTPVQAYQPVRLVDATGAAVATPAANADGSQDVSGVNGTSVATIANAFPTTTNGVISTAVASATNPFPTSTTPNSLATSAPTSTQTTTATGSLTAKASAGNCYGFNAVSGASAGYLMLFDSTTVPADGTVTPKKVYVMAANSSLGLHWDVPRRFGTGITAVFSTTGPFTKTISATAFISVDYV